MKLFEDLPSTNMPITAKNLNQIKDKLVVVSATEPTGDNREKVWMHKGKNLFDKNNNIQIGYFINDTGTPINNNENWYQSTYIKVKPNTKYTISSKVGVLRIIYYSKDKDFISRNTTEGTSLTVTIPSNCEYIRVSGVLANNQIDSLQVEQEITATEYEAYIEPKIYVKNDNDVYEEFINENNIKKSIIDAYRNDYTTTGTNWEKVEFAGISNIKGNAFSIQDGDIICNKSMLVSIEGAYYWTGISAKRVGYKINKNDTTLNNAVYNKFCPTGGYYDVAFDRIVAQVSKGDKLSLYVRTEEGAGGTSGSRGKFIVQEL